MFIRIHHGVDSTGFNVFLLTECNSIYLSHNEETKKTNVTVVYLNHKTEVFEVPESSNQPMLDIINDRGETIITY